MKRFAPLSLLLSTLIITACGDLVIKPISPFPTANVTSLGSATEAKESGNVTRTDTDVYKINVGNIPSSDDVVYFEASNSDVELVLYDNSGKARRQSTSANLFRDVTNISTSDLDSQGISVDPKIGSCRGSCIIVDKGEGTVYLRVRSKTNAPVNYDLFIFSDEYRDTSEPDNEPVNGECVFNTSTLIHAAGIVITPTDPYAIETVEDVDCFSSTTSASSITLSADAELTFAIKAEILDRNGTPLRFTDGRPAVLTVTPSDLNSEALAAFPSEFILRVSSANGYAAPADHSQYSISFGN